MSPTLALGFIRCVTPFLSNRQDINEIWEMSDPMAALATVLSNDGRGEPESRLLWAAGKDTMMACFHIGVYSDRELLGQGAYREVA